MSYSKNAEEIVLNNLHVELKTTLRESIKSLELFKIDLSQCSLVNDTGD